MSNPTSQLDSCRTRQSQKSLKNVVIFWIIFKRRNKISTAKQFRARPNVIGRYFRKFVYRGKTKRFDWKLVVISKGNAIVLLLKYTTGLDRPHYWLIYCATIYRNCGNLTVYTKVVQPFGGPIYTSIKTLRTTKKMWCYYLFFIMHKLLYYRLILTYIYDG